MIPRVSFKGTDLSSMSASGGFMKKIIIIALLLVATVVGSSIWIGTTIEERFTPFLQQAAALGQFQIEIDSYERGFFRSRAQTSLFIPSVTGTPERITLQHTLWHGPFPFGIDSLGNWHLQPCATVIETRLTDSNSNEGMIGQFLQLLPELSNLHEITNIDFSGNGQVLVTLPAFNRDFVRDEIKTTVEWGGLTGEQTFDSTLSNISGRFDLPGLRIIKPQFILEFGKIDTNFRLNLAENGILLGQVNLNAESITGGDRGPTPAFVLKGFQFHNLALQESDTINYSTEMVADTLLAAGNQVGPLGYKIDFNHLDAATIVKVQQQLQALQFDMVDSPADETGARILNIYLEALPALLQKSPEISLNYLRIQSPDGELWGKGVVAFDGADKPPIRDLDSFAGVVTGKSEFQISASLLQSVLRKFLTPNFMMMRETGQMGEIDDATFASSLDQAISGQIANLVTQGLLTEDGSNYRLEFNYQNRQSTLNGKPFPLF